MELARDEHVKRTTELLFLMEKEYLVAVKDFRTRVGKFLKNSKAGAKKASKKHKQKIEKEKAPKDNQSQSSDKENQANISTNNENPDPERFFCKKGGDVIFGESLTLGNKQLAEFFSEEIRLGSEVSDLYEAVQPTLWLHPSSQEINSAVKSRGMTLLSQNSRFAVRDSGNLRIGLSDLIAVFFKISDRVSPEMGCLDVSEKRKFAMERLMDYWYMLDQKEVNKWQLTLARNVADDQTRKQLSEIIKFEDGSIDDSASFSNHFSKFAYETKSGTNIAPNLSLGNQQMIGALCQCNDLIKTDNCSLCRKFLFLCDKILDVRMNAFKENSDCFLEIFVYYTFRYLQVKNEIKLRRKTHTTWSCYIECEELSRKNQFYKFVIGFCLRNWRHFEHYPQKFTRLQSYFYLFDPQFDGFTSQKPLEDLTKESFPWLEGTSDMKPNVFNYDRKDIFFFKFERIIDLGFKHKASKLLRLSRTISQGHFYDISYFAGKLRSDESKEKVLIQMLEHYFEMAHNNGDMENLIIHVAEDFGLENLLVLFVFYKLVDKFDYSSVIRAVKIVNKSHFNSKFLGFFLQSFLKKYSLLVSETDPDPKEAFKGLVYYNDTYLDQKMRDFALAIYNKYKDSFYFLSSKILVEILSEQADIFQIKYIFSQNFEQEGFDFRKFNELIDILSNHEMSKLAIEIVLKAIADSKFCSEDILSLCLTLYTDADEKIKAIETIEQLALNPDFELSVNTFKYKIKKLISDCSSDKCLILKIETIINCFIQRAENSETYSDNDLEEAYMARYWVIKRLYGRSHFMIEKYLMDIADKAIETQNYLSYTNRRRVEKYFIQTRQFERGFKVFLELWQIDFNYSLLEKLSSFATFTGNYQILYDKAIKHFDSIEHDPDNLDYVTQVLVEAKRKDLAVELWDKFREFRIKEDNMDEQFYDYRIKFYRDSMGDMDKALEIFKDAIDADVFFYQYEIDELAAICSSKGKSDEFMKIFRYYIMKHENGNDSCTRLFIETLHTKHTPAKMFVILDEILEEMNVKVVTPVKGKGIEREFIFKKTNLLTCKEIQDPETNVNLDFDASGNKIIGSVKADSKKSNHDNEITKHRKQSGFYSVEKVLTLKGVESDRDLFLTNRYKGKSELGLDYSKNKDKITSIAEIATISNFKGLAINENIDYELGLMRILKKTGLRPGTVRSQVSEFLSSLQMDMNLQCQAGPSKDEEQEDKSDLVNDDEISLNLGGLFDESSSEDVANSKHEDAMDLMYDSRMSSEEIIEVERSQNLEEQITDLAEMVEEIASMAIPLLGISVDEDDEIEEETGENEDENEDEDDDDETEDEDEDENDTEDSEDSEDSESEDDVMNMAMIQESSTLSESQADSTPDDKDMAVIGTSIPDIQYIPSPEMSIYTKPNQVEDIMGPTFNRQVIYENEEGQTNKDQIMEHTNHSADTVKLLMKSRAKCQALSGDFEGGLAFLSANFGIYDNQFMNTIYNYCKDHMSIGDMKSLNNEFYGNIKRSYFDLMKIKNYCKADHSKDAEDELCVICYDYLVDGELFSRGGCKHVFHAACCFGWIRENGSCPICRHVYTRD